MAAIIPALKFVSGTVALETVGFWTPEYLRKKEKTLRLFADHRLLIAVGAGARHNP